MFYIDNVLIMGKKTNVLSWTTVQFSVTKGTPPPQLASRWFSAGAADLVAAMLYGA